MDDELKYLEKLQQHNQSNDSNLNLSAASGSVPLTMLPPLPKKEILKAPERREILGYTAAQMMDYANAAVSATWNSAHIL